MALNKGIWDPKLRGTNIKGTNLKSLTLTTSELPATPRAWTESPGAHVPAGSSYVPNKDYGCRAEGLGVLRN